ncbi:MAG: hypothetical protein V7744_20860 [Pseudomonadales bacterium]
MNWDTIGAIGEIIGALAVVVSLVYLAAQIRTQNKEARAAAAHDIYEGFRDVMGTFADRDNAEVLARANEDVNSLSEVDRIILISCVQRLMRLWEEAYHQHRQGRLDDEIWQSMVDQYASFLANASGAHIWKIRKNYFTPGFREFVATVNITEHTYK